MSLLLLTYSEKETPAICEKEDEKADFDFINTGKNIIPVGGGKDSNVTMELLKKYREDNYCFTVNNQGARTESAAAAVDTASCFVPGAGPAGAKCAAF